MYFFWTVIVFSMLCFAFLVFVFERRYAMFCNAPLSDQRKEKGKVLLNNVSTGKSQTNVSTGYSRAGENLQLQESPRHGNPSASFDGAATAAMSTRTTPADRSSSWEQGRTSTLVRYAKIIVQTFHLPSVSI